MERAAGLVLLYRNERILLVHPTNASWQKTFGIPKGLLEYSENALETAIRETEEEIGIKIKKDKIGLPYSIYYFDQKQKPTKEIIYFYVYIDNLEEIGLDSFIIPKENLQKEEVDWAGFLPIKEARNKIFYKQIPILDEIESADWKKRG